MDEEVKRSRAKKKLLRVTFPNGKVICYNNATSTMIAVLNEIGEDLFSSIKLEMCHLPLLSKEIYPKYQKDMKPVDLAHNPIGILVLCIIAPIAEEYLFRGLMMRKMLRWNISPWYAIIASSIMFGLIHLNPAQIPGAIILGIVMAWMCYRTKSLIPGIIIHITNNTLCLIPEECYDTYIASTPMIEGGLSLVSIAIVILSIWLFNKKTAAAS